MSESLVLAMPSAHRLARRAKLSLKELADDSFLLYPRANGRALFDLIVPAFMAQVRTAGVVYRPLNKAPKASITVVRPHAAEPKAAVIFTELVRARSKTARLPEALLK